MFSCISLCNKALQGHNVNVNLVNWKISYEFITPEMISHPLDYPKLCKNQRFYIKYESYVKCAKKPLMTFHFCEKLLLSSKYLIKYLLSRNIVALTAALLLKHWLQHCYWHRSFLERYKTVLGQAGLIKNFTSGPQHAGASCSRVGIVTSIKERPQLSLEHSPAEASAQLT